MTYIGTLSWLSPEQGGRKIPFQGSIYKATIALPEDLNDEQISGCFTFNNEIVQLDFLNPNLAKEFLKSVTISSTLLVMEGERVVAKYIITAIKES